jgi:hypothetical protein
VNVEIIQRNTTDKLFHVYLRDGRTFPVPAATWGRRVTPDDEIKFFDNQGAEIKDVFLRAPDTSAIAPESSSEVPAPIVALRNDVETLKIQMSQITNNLGDIVRKAIADELSERGL